jgi:methylglyoxal synthase
MRRVASPPRGTVIRTIGQSSWFTPSTLVTASQTAVQSVPSADETVKLRTLPTLTVIPQEDRRFVRREDANAPEMADSACMPRTSRALLLAVLVLAALALPASAMADPSVVDHVSQGPVGGNGPVHHQQGYLSDDGRCVTFTSDEKLTNDDQNSRGDIYERCGSTTSLISTGPAPNAGTKPSPYLEYRAMSTDGGCVLFDTNEVLTEDDGDSSIDIYKRCGSDIQRVSQGPNGGDVNQDVHHGTLSADGVCVVFQAHEALTSDDHDSIPDLFERCGTTTKHVTVGPAGGDDPSVGANLEAVTPDGSCVLFTTQEKLTDDDDEASPNRDAYVRCGSTIRKASPGNGAHDVSTDWLSPDGQCVVFETEEQLADTDSDSQNDTYTACGTSLRHDTTGPAGGSGDFYNSADAISDDGSCVVFDTAEKLTPDDNDTSSDAYKRCGANIERVSTGPNGGNAEIDAETEWISPDGRCVVFASVEHITSDDSDASADLFERCGDATDRVSQGPAGGNGSFEPQAIDISTDGTRVIFTTDEQLTSDDGNGVTDIYERSNGQTTKVSPALASASVYGSNPSDSSADATRVLFGRFDRLTSDDMDDRFDLYTVTLAPTAATGGASDVTTTSATLNGTSSAGKYHFEYGGTSTPEADLGAAGAIKPVSATVTGLTPDTTYTYRLVVSGPAGTTTSVERSFKTAAVPVAGGSDNSGNNGGGTDDGGDQATPPPAAKFTGVAIAGGSVKVKRGVATVKVTCPATAQVACDGKLTLKLGRGAIGSKTFSVKPGKSKSVHVRISRTAKKRLAKRGKLRVTATAVARDARGTAVKSPGKKLTLKR